MNDTEDFLAHYGVKGMRWGVRKDRRAKSGAAKPAYKGASRGKAPGTRSYDVKKLNNRELKKVVERMKLEQEYARLNSPKKKKGKSFVTNYLKTEGGKLFKQYVTPASIGVGVGVAGALLSKNQPLGIDWKKPLTS